MANEFEDEFLNDFTHSGNEEEEEEDVERGEEDVGRDEGGSASEQEDGEEITFKMEEVVSASTNEPKRQVKHDANFLALVDFVSRPEAHNASSLTSFELEDKLNQCNTFLARISSETLVWHRLASQAYAPIFPELEKLVVDPVDFARVLLQYGESDTPRDLSEVLNAATVMVVKVSKSAHANSIAQLVREEEKAQLKFALHCAQEILQLDSQRQALLRFVEIQLRSFAPNLYELIGSRTAAMLLTLAGGLGKLSKIPSNDIQVLGKRKQGDVSVVHGENFVFLRHAGVLAQCPLVLSAPPDLRRKIVRVLAGRVALAARVDETGKNKSNAQGKAWRIEVEEKIRQWQEPGQEKAKKALPVPDMQRPKRRGGRRARKLKEKMGATTMLKLANRQHFGEGADANVEYSVSAMGEDLGLLSKQQNGRVRQVQIKDTQRLAERAAAANSKRLRPINTASGGGGGALTSGFTSLAFTPVQGMELTAKPRQETNKQPLPAVPLFKRA